MAGPEGFPAKPSQPPIPALDAETLERMLADHIDRVERTVKKLADGQAGRRHLTLKGAAEYAARSADTIKRACLRRELKYTQDGRGAVITIAVGDLDRWLEKHAVREVRA